MTTIEGNKLISKFMNDGNGSLIWTSDGAGGKISYDNSWDLLMPVWFKFRDLKVSEELHNQHLGLKYYIANAICYGQSGDYISAHSKLVEAIIWYNTQTTKP